MSGTLNSINCPFWIPLIDPSDTGQIWMNWEASWDAGSSEVEVS